MSSTSFHLARPLSCILALGLLACGESVETVDGDCGSMFGSQVCTWATVSGDDVIAFGATVPVSAIESAPLDAPMVWPPSPVAIIGLPQQVTQTLGFDHLMINWEAHGHPPALFMTPHFDFHFYTVDATDVAAMDCSDMSKPSQLPTDYALPDIQVPEIGELVGLCVPSMGMHAMPAEEVDQTEPFSTSTLVGYYHGNVIFVEPMIAREKLLADESFSLTVPSVPSVGAGVSWPVSFEAVFDEATQSYRFTYSVAEED
jgi:hypothetical protein